MDLKTVKSCFEKFVNYMERKEKISSTEEFDIENISIQDIDKLTQILFMNYIIKNDSKINQNNSTCILYKHVNSLIRRYFQDETNKTTDLFQNYLFRFDDNLKSNNINSKIEENISHANTSKGWFF